MGGRAGGTLCPRIWRKQPAHPLTRQPAQRTRQPSPRSQPLTGLACCLPKNAPCISIFLAVSLACTARPRPPRLSSAALSVLVPSLPTAYVPKANAKPTFKEAQGERAYLPRRAPRSPPSRALLPYSLDYGNECHLDGEPRVRSPSTRLWVPVRGSCALPDALSPSARLCPPPRLGSTPRSPRPPSCPFLPRS